MPLLRMSHRAGMADAPRQPLSDGVRQAMGSTGTVPAGDRFRIHTEQASVPICLVGNDSPDWSFRYGGAQHVG